MESAVIKVGERYSIYRYEKDNFPNGRFGCTIFKTKEEAEKFINRR